MIVSCRSIDGLSGPRETPGEGDAPRAIVSATATTEREPRSALYRSALAGRRGWALRASYDTCACHRSQKKGPSSGPFPVVKIQDLLLGVLHGVFHISDSGAHRAFRLVHFAFGLELGVTGQTTNGILYRKLALSAAPLVEVSKQRRSPLMVTSNRIGGSSRALCPGLTALSPARLPAFGRSQPGSAGRAEPSRRTSASPFCDIRHRG